MSTIDYKALAERVAQRAIYADNNADPNNKTWAADLRTVVSLLNGMADAQPVAWRCEVRDLLTQAEQCLSTAVRFEQWAHDEPPSYLSAWDYEADHIAAEIRAMLTAAPAAPQAEPTRDWSAIDAAIREYLDGYEQIGENDAGADACYTPTERERDLIYDAINGLLADESFVAAISAPQAEQPIDLDALDSYPPSGMTRAADYLRAQADALPVPAVPAGWKLVPVEPTPEMLSAVGMMDGYDWHAPGCSPDADHANWYSAMIAAAPAAPQAAPMADSDADYWLRNRQPILDTIERAGFMLMSNASGFWLHPRGKTDAQAAVCELKRELAMAKREPLSDEQMRAVLIAEARRIAEQAGEKDPDSLPVDEEMLAQVMLAGRAVERAHGIGGSDAE